MLQTETPNAVLKFEYGRFARAAAYPKEVEVSTRGRSRQEIGDLEKHVATLAPAETATGPDNKGVLVDAMACSDCGAPGARLFGGQHARLDESVDKFDLRRVDCVVVFERCANGLRHCDMAACGAEKL